MLSIKISTNQFDTLSPACRKSCMYLTSAVSLKIFFFKKNLSGILSVFNTFWIQIRPDLGPNCLQRLSEDDKIGH